MRRYWGTAEIAQVCGVRQSAVSNWLARGQMPKPAARLRMGPVWDAQNLEFHKWLRDKRRRKAA